MKPIGLAAVEWLSLRVRDRERVLRSSTGLRESHRRRDAGGVEKEERACIEQAGAVTQELVAAAYERDLPRTIRVEVSFRVTRAIGKCACSGAAYRSSL